MKDRREEVVAAVAAAGWETDDCHDLLHRPFTPACRGLPDGPGRHLQLWWRYQAWAGWRRRVACRAGRHRPLPFWDPDAAPGDLLDGWLCRDCGQVCSWGPLAPIPAHPNRKEMA